MLAGMAVFVVWVGPETSWAGRFPALQNAYLKWAVWPLGRMPEAVSSSPYAPTVCGWPLSIARLAGSFVVIALIEEFFWRGFLYRWLMGRDFLQVSHRAFHWWIFLAVSFGFGLEHPRWLVGAVAGLVYGGLYVRSGDIWAAGVAHAVTNLLLGLYVLGTGAYGFW
jgi:CAAX prenyl protease-like protein